MKKIFILITAVFFYQFALGQEYLLKPSGKYDVGFKDFHWIHGEQNSDGNYVCPDKNQDPFYKYGETKENFSSNNQINFCRELMVRVYFPIINHSSTDYETIYKPSADDLVNEIKNLKLSNITNEDYSQFQTLKTYAYDFNNSNIILNGQSVLPEVKRNKFPVIFFSPGNGEDFQAYGNIISELSSHGYIVVGINFTFVSDAILFPSNRIAYRNGDIISGHDNELTSVLPTTDILFTLKKSYELAQLEKMDSIFSYMDMENTALLGHSGGANASVTVSQNKSAVSQFHINAVGSLDTGYGVFSSANCVDVTTGQVFTNPPPPTLSYGNFDTVGTSIPFMHMHSSADDYGCAIPTFGYLENDSRTPDQFLVHNPDEYWVYVAPKATYDDTPKAPQPVPINIPSDVFYSAHHNFSDYGSLQYLNMFKKTIQYFQLQNPIDIATPLMIGNHDGIELTKKVNSYLIQFFDKYLKSNEHMLSPNLDSCSAISNTMLKCKNVP